MHDELDKAIQAEWKTVLYKNILHDPLVEKFIHLLKDLTKTLPVPSQVLVSYYDFATSFIPRAAEISAPGREPWRDYITHLILQDENLFSRQAESLEMTRIPLPILAMAERDLIQLQKLASVSSQTLRRLLAERIGKGIEIETLPDWEGIFIDEDRRAKDQAKEEMKAYFHELKAWDQAVGRLGSYYRENGSGIFGQYHAFRWLKQGGEGRLAGVKNLDAIQLNQLYEYEREQNKVIQNTEQFLAGYPANNVLLYGDRGTGKSSTVKALVNRYGKKGLRLVEIQKQDLEDFPEIIDILARRPQKFILFVDDLSFTEGEGEYRELKALLEGGLETKPRNVLVYATSNRRHLVQESFADRNVTGFDPDNEDVRYMDTVQEKLSLADRFGIAITFSAPDQKRYLAIVDKLARERGLEIPSEELHSRALKWELSFNARSARTAKQFIDFLEGQLGLERN